MLEKDVQATVLEAAALGGWRVAHFRTAMNSRGRYMTPVAADGKGFPDLVCVRDRVWPIEVKSDTGRVSVDQAEWLRWFDRAGCPSTVCRPDNLDAVIAGLMARPKWPAP